MRPVRASLLLALLGVLLLANGAYVYPEDVSYEQEYRAVAERIEPGEHPTGEFGVTTIHECSGNVDSEECAEARYLAQVGEIRVEDPGDVYGDVTNESEQLPEFFHLGEHYYRRTASLDNGSLVLSMEEIADERVFDIAAENASDVRPVYRTAIENGSVRTTEELHRDRTIVEDGDRFYVVRTSGPARGEVTGWGWKEPGQEVIRLLRVLGWTGGVALIWFAGYRYAKQS